jgi:AcrR family transcriptional regulator
MPPKVRIAKDMILDKAFSMTRENGFDSVTARGLADVLGCSTQPIFRVYETMEMLRQDLCGKAQEFFASYISEYLSDSAKGGAGKSKTEGEPKFLNMGITYIELAKRETHLFNLLCTGISGTAETVETDSKSNLQVKENELLLMARIFSHGIASMTANRSIHLSDEEIRELLMKAYKAFENE